MTDGTARATHGAGPPARVAPRAVTGVDESS